MLVRSSLGFPSLNAMSIRSRPFDSYTTYGRWPLPSTSRRARDQDVPSIEVEKVGSKLPPRQKRNSGRGSSASHTGFG